MTSPSYQTIDLPLVGPSNENRSRPASIQSTRNMYPENTGSGGIDQFIFHSWANTEVEDFTFGTVVGMGQDRGMYSFNGDLYRVADDKLIRYQANDLDSPVIADRLTATEIGTIAGASRCGFADNGIVMVITNGLTPYQWDGTSLTLLSGLTFNPTNVQFLNERFIFDGDDVVDNTQSRRWYVSDVESTSVDVGNSGYARSRPDQFVTPFVFDQIVYLFGKNSIEPQNLTGVDLAPLSRIDSGIIENLGVCNPFAMINTDNALYWVSNRGMPYRMISFKQQKISSVGIEESWKDLNLDNVHLQVIYRYNQTFVLFTFRTDNQTWVFSEETQEWFQLSSGNVDTSDRYKQGQYLGSSFLDIFGKTYVSPYNQFTLFSLTDELQLVPDYSAKERILAVIAGDTFGKPGTSYEMAKIRISMECCNGLNTTSSLDNIDDPVLMVSFSKDGKNFGAEIWKPIGQEGENKQIEVTQMSQFRRLYVKLRVTDRSMLHLYGISMDIREAGE